MVQYVILFFLMKKKKKKTGDASREKNVAQRF